MRLLDRLLGRQERAAGSGPGTARAGDPLERLPPDAAALIRTAHLPVTEDGEFGASSGFGGFPVVAPGNEHPICPNCERPMPMLAQLAIRDLPEHARPLGSGIIQLFYCDQAREGMDVACDVELEAWAAFSEGSVARMITAPGHEVSTLGRAHPPKRVVSWEPARDAPNSDEFEANGVNVEDSLSLALGDAGIPRSGEKIGGWPCWIQGIEYPNCPICSEQMRMVLQVDSEQNVPVMFGDVGIGHVTQCPSHPEVLAFAWACS